MNMKKTIPVFLITASFIMLLGLSVLKSQTKNCFAAYEDSLKIIAPEILYGKHDFNRYEAHQKFMRILIDVLNIEDSYKYDFDSLKTISILRSPDNMFRIFTWNLQKNDGSYDFFGLIQLNPKKTEGDLVVELKNIKNTDNKMAMREILEPSQWYGAHYYKLLMNKYKGDKYYTLLGWDGNNTLTTRKIIDVLVFDKKDRIRFGVPVFQTNEALLNRYILEYGAHVAVSLKYEKQFLYDGKNKKWMIVFDRVSPLSPMLEGQYRFYVPETNIFDAFIFEKGIWQMYEDVDARTPKKTKIKNLPRPD